MEQLCENWSRDFAADLDRCGNAISHDSLHRWSGEWDLNYSCQVSKKGPGPASLPGRSEEHTSELQSLMRISYAVFCLKKKKYKKVTSRNTLGDIRSLPCNSNYTSNLITNNTTR